MGKTIMTNESRKTVQVPIDIYEDLCLLFLLDNYDLNPERVAEARRRIQKFLQTKKENDVRHEFYSKNKKMPDAEYIKDHVRIFCAYLKLCRG